MTNPDAFLARQGPRIALIVLLDEQGNMLGQLPEVAVATPWWQEVGDVVDAVRERFGLDVTLLRLLSSERSRPHGGRVTYLAETAHGAQAIPRLIPFSGALPSDGLRLPWAHPGGPARDLAWSRRVLADAGYEGPLSARQVRSWNLSSIWRLEVAGNAFWLKVVPPFFDHEGSIIDLLREERVPRLVAFEGPRMLMHEIPGEDRYGSSEAQIRAMIDLLVDLQWRWHDRIELFRARGMPTWGLNDHVTRAEGLLELYGGALLAGERRQIEALVRNLPERWASIEGCGIPQSIVHGDFHPGNVRSRGASLTILDWGDCSIGHPLLDQPAMLARVAPERVGALARYWRDAWQERVPDADAATARQLIEPLAALRLALVYQNFLENIEVSERVYHRDDPAMELRKAAAILRQSG